MLVKNMNPLCKGITPSHGTFSFFLEAKGNMATLQLTLRMCISYPLSTTDQKPSLNTLIIIIWWQWERLTNQRRPRRVKQLDEGPKQWNSHTHLSREKVDILVILGSDEEVWIGKHPQSHFQFRIMTEELRLHSAHSLTKHCSVFSGDVQDWLVSRGLTHSPGKRDPTGLMW